MSNPCGCKGYVTFKPDTGTPIPRLPKGCEGFVAVWREDGESLTFRPIQIQDESQYVVSALATPIAAVNVWTELAGSQFNVTVECNPACPPPCVGIFKLMATFGFSGVVCGEPYDWGVRVDGFDVVLGRTAQHGTAAMNGTVLPGQNNLLGVGTDRINLAPGLHTIALIVRKPSGAAVGVANARALSWTNDF